MQHFVVRRAGRLVDEDLNTGVLVLAESEDGATGRRLEIQRSLRMDEQDRDLGMDTYCLVNEIGATVYGGVVMSWTLARGILLLVLEPEAAAVVGAGSGLELALAPGLIDEQVVRSALAVILDQAETK